MKYNLSNPLNFDSRSKHITLEDCERKEISLLNKLFKKSIVQQIKKKDHLKDFVCVVQAKDITNVFLK